MSQPLSSYPAHWDIEVTLDQGATVQLRPIRPEDGDKLADFYEGVSQRAKRLRFLASMPPLTEAYISKLTHIDYHDRVVLVVTLGEEMIALGQYAVTEPGVADIAVLVQDEYEGHGLGQLLMGHLGQIARECGVQHLTAQVLAENRRMIQIMRDQYEQVDQDVEATGELHIGIVYLDFNIDDLPTAHPTLDKLWS